MQWTQHGGESMAHPRSSRGSILAAGAFTSHAPQPRLPHAATTRATSLGSFAHGCATTHKERTIRVPRKMMPPLVTNKFMYNEAGARCIVPSLSRGLTLTAEASTSHEPVLPSAMLPHRCHFTPSSTAMHPAQDCFASRHAAAACHSAASPEPRVITTHKP